MSASAAAASTNQALTSWLLTTSPRLTASSSRRWVGSSVFSALSCSSAMPEAALHALAHGAGVRRELAQHAFDPIEIGAHHRAEREDQDQEPHQDRERHADEEHLHLRHQ